MCVIRSNKSDRCIDNHCSVYLFVRIVLVFNIQPMTQSHYKMHRIFKKVLFIRVLRFNYIIYGIQKETCQTTIKYVFVGIKNFRERLLC